MVQMTNLHVYRDSLMQLVDSLRFFVFFVRTHVLFIYLLVDNFFFNFVIVCLTHNVLYHLYHRWVPKKILNRKESTKQLLNLCILVSLQSSIFLFLVILNVVLQSICLPVPLQTVGVPQTIYTYPMEGMVFSSLFIYFCLF